MKIHPSIAFVAFLCLGEDKVGRMLFLNESFELRENGERSSRLPSKVYNEIGGYSPSSFAIYRHPLVQDFRIKASFIGVHRAFVFHRLPSRFFRVLV